MSFVAVSGFQGTGKTTLARGLAATLGWAYLPEARQAIVLLKDLFSDPSRWAFETQTAFLVNKAVELQQALARDLNIVLDRTLYEDAEVFGEFFYRTGAIDSRSYTTFRALADHFFTELPGPDLVLLCRCPVEVARARIVDRKDGFAKLYPPHHLEDIERLYEEWRSRYRRSAIVEVNTQKTDLRLKKNIEQISKEVLGLLVHVRSQSDQLDLFNDSIATPSADGLLVRPVSLFPDAPVGRGRARVLKPEVRVTPYPSAFIAAPFTIYADASTEREHYGPDLFGGARLHGVLGKGWYRGFLLRIERGLRRLGVHSIIPHRDVNRWGERTLTAAQVTKLCSDYVFETNVFVGLLSTSHGAHYEFGLAKGLGKPAIIIRVSQIQESFISGGVSEDLKDTLVLNLERDDDMEAALLSADVRRFLARFIPIRGAI